MGYQLHLANMRINFFAGPGAGKSTTTARVFSQLKERHFSVEHVNEYVKSWAYQKRSIKKFDQVYLFGKQQQYEYRFLSSGVKNIVTDSPCFLSVIYAQKYATDTSEEVANAIRMLCREYDKDFPCTNIFLHRGAKPYVQEGRYQDYAAAQELDNFMLKILKETYPDNLIEVDYQDKDKILEIVIGAVEK